MYCATVQPGRERKPWVAYAFLHSLGWHAKKHVRSIYYDGHERADVVSRRITFLAEMAEYEKKMTKYEGPDCMIEVPPVLQPGEREHVLIVHDESTYYANEDESMEWVEEGRALAVGIEEGTNRVLGTSRKCPWDILGLCG